METITQLSHFWADLHVCLWSPLRGWEDWIVNSLVLDPLLILSNSAPNMKSSASVLKLSSKGFHSAILDDRGRMKWDWPLKHTMHKQGRFQIQIFLFTTFYNKCLESGKQANISKWRQWHTSTSNPFAPTKQHPNAHTHSCMNTHIHTPARARTHARTHTHTHTHAISMSNVPM